MALTREGPQDDSDHSGQQAFYSGPQEEREQEADSSLGIQHSSWNHAHDQGLGIFKCFQHGARYLGSDHLSKHLLLGAAQVVSHGVHVL